MDIECKLKRPGGTRVTIETTDYHFVPLTDGAHVAKVDSAAHQDRFLAIAEAYGPYRGKGKPKASAPAEVPAPAPQPAPDSAPSTPEPTGLLGAPGYPASFDINGAAFTIEQIIAQAQEASGLDADAWNALDEDARADLIDAELDKIAGTAGDPERVALVEQYVARFGKKPHGKWNADKIREALAQ